MPPRLGIHLLAGLKKITVGFPRCQVTRTTVGGVHGVGIGHVFIAPESIFEDLVADLGGQDSE